MGDYNLAPGELIIMQESSALLQEGEDDREIDEVVLTNQNLILVDSVSRGLFKRERYIKRCPLENILRGGNGEPQIVVSRYHGRHLLQVAFQSETVALMFFGDDKREAKRWAKNIRNTALGYLTELQDEDELPSEVADAIDNVKSFVGALTGKRESKLPPPAKGSVPVPLPPPAGRAAGIGSSIAAALAGGAASAAATNTAASATRKCSGCHAPLTGRAGVTVTCEYCGTTQTI